MGLVDRWTGGGRDDKTKDIATRVGKPNARPTIQTQAEQENKSTTDILAVQAGDARSSAVIATPLKQDGSGVQQGESTTSRVAEVTHGAGDIRKNQQAAPELERIPSALSAPVSALAQRVLAPDEVWKGSPKAVSQDMRDAIRVLDIAEQSAIAQGSSLPDMVSVEGRDVPVWLYIGQCVDAIGTGTIDDISTTLTNLMANPQLAPLVPRIVALHLAQVFLSHQDIKAASKNFMGVSTMNVEYYKQSDPIFIARLEAVAEYVKTHPDAGVLVRAFFGYQTPLLNTLNPAHMILKYCGIT